MPAVNPARLRFQMEDLLKSFSSPREFHRQLQKLFSLYANRALRFGESSGTKPLLPMYNLPQPVIRQLRLDLSAVIKEFPDDALNLADELWLDEYYEIKQTAIFVLGAIPIRNPEPILDRVEGWLSPALDSTLKKDILSSGVVGIQSAFPEIWESFIESLLSNDEQKIITLGVLGLTEGLKNPAYTNLPVIFRLISPLIQSPQPAFIHPLTALVDALAQRSPTETSFFLQQTLSLSGSKETARLVKGCLDSFPPDLRQGLRESLKR